MPGQANHYLGEHVETPDLMEKVTAWRTWKLQKQNEEAQLVSFSARTVWPAVIKAECKANALGHKSHLHGKTPSADCSCGVYGFFDAADAHNIDQGVVGVCEHWGKTEVHNAGIRSEHAAIKAIYCSPKTLCTCFYVPQKLVLSAAFLVPVCTYTFAMSIFSIISALIPIVAGLLLLFNLALIFSRGWLASKKSNPLEKWAGQNKVVICKSLAELERYHSSPLPESLRIAL